MGGAGMVGDGGAGVGVSFGPTAIVRDPWKAQVEVDLNRSPVSIGSATTAVCDVVLSSETNARN